MAALGLRCRCQAKRSDRDPSPVLTLDLKQDLGSSRNNQPSVKYAHDIEFSSLSTNTMEHSTNNSGCFGSLFSLRRFQKCRPSKAAEPTLDVRSPAASNKESALKEKALDTESDKVKISRCGATSPDNNNLVAISSLITSALFVITRAGYPPHGGHWTRLRVPPFTLLREYLTNPPTT